MLITCRTMRYGERLQKAMDFAKLKQYELADMVGIKQPSISHLINGQNVTGSEYTVQLAIACGVRPEWLAMEEGEMVDGLYVHDERIKRGVQILEQLQSEYRLDDAIELLNSVAKLTSKKASE